MHASVLRAPSVLVASAVVLVLLLMVFMNRSGPTEAVTLSVTGLSGAIEQGQSVSFSVDVFIFAGERIPVQSIEVRMEGPTPVVLTFSPQGEVMSGSSQVSSVRLASSPFSGWGDLYGFDPQEEQGYFFADGPGFGFGYGSPGSTNLTYQLVLETASMETGDYTVKVVVNTGDQVKPTFSSLPQSFSITTPAGIKSDVRSADGAGSASASGGQPSRAQPLSIWLWVPIGIVWVWALGALVWLLIRWRGRLWWRG